MTRLRRPNSGDCDFAEGGPDTGQGTVALWRAASDPLILTARSIASAPGEADVFDLRRLAADITVLRRGDDPERVLIANGARQLRLELSGDPITAGPVRLQFAISGFREIRTKLLQLGRLEALVRRGHLPAHLYPCDPVAIRWARALWAWDLKRSGASQIEIAIALFGDGQVVEASVEYMRKRVARLLALADARIAAGYRRFFGRR